MRLCCGPPPLPHTGLVSGGQVQSPLLHGVGCTRKTCVTSHQVMVHGQGSSQGLRQEVDVWLWQLASGVRGEGGTPPACTWGPGCLGCPQHGPVPRASLPKLSQGCSDRRCGPTGSIHFSCSSFLGGLLSGDDARTAPEPDP